jgi:hypothetical protein
LLRRSLGLLTEESDPSALIKVDGVSRAALGLLQEASPVLATAKAGLEKLGRFLEKVCHCHLPFSLSRLMRLINWVARATARLAVLSTLPFSHARLPLLWH